MKKIFLLLVLFYWPVLGHTEEPAKQNRSEAVEKETETKLKELRQRMKQLEKEGYFLDEDEKRSQSCESR
jgi:hypothetical protein